MADGHTHPGLIWIARKSRPTRRDYFQEPCKGQTGMITVMSPLASRSAVIFDLDNDGDLDIVTNDFNSAPQVLVSNLSERQRVHWLKVKLIGTVSNRDGLGATVRVTCWRPDFDEIQRWQVRLPLTKFTPPVLWLGRGAENRSRRGRLAFGTEAGGNSRSSLE